MSLTAIQNKDNVFEGKITILRPSGGVQEAVGNTVVGSRERPGKET